MKALLPPPASASELKGWMRKAGSDDFAHWLTVDPDAYAMFAPHAHLVEGHVLALPDDAQPFAIRFTATDRALNPWGHVHGGVVLGLMDEVLSAAAALLVGPRHFGATTSMSVVFMRPLRDHRFQITATVLERSFSMVALRGQLFNEAGVLHEEALASFSVRSPLAGGREDH